MKMFGRLRCLLYLLGITVALTRAIPACATEWVGEADPGITEQDRTLCDLLFSERTASPVGGAAGGVRPAALNYAAREEIVLISYGDVFERVLKTHYGEGFVVDNRVLTVLAEMIQERSASNPRLRTFSDAQEMNHIYPGNQILLPSMQDVLDRIRGFSSMNLTAVAPPVAQPVMPWPHVKLPPGKSDEDVLITVNGSGTVYPLTRLAAVCFVHEGSVYQAQGSAARFVRFKGHIKLDETSTTEGIRQYCKSNAIIANASEEVTVPLNNRIKDDDARKDCEDPHSPHPTPMAFPIASDKILIVTSDSDSDSEHHSRDQLRDRLKKIDLSLGQARDLLRGRLKWSDLVSTPDSKTTGAVPSGDTAGAPLPPLTVHFPSRGSGTLRKLEQLLGLPDGALWKIDDPIVSYLPKDDYNELATEIAGTPGAVGILPQSTFALERLKPSRAIWIDHLISLKLDGRTADEPPMPGPRFGYALQRDIYIYVSEQDVRDTPYLFEFLDFYFKFAPILARHAGLLGRPMDKNTEQLMMWK